MLNLADWHRPHRRPKKRRCCARRRRAAVLAPAAPACAARQATGAQMAADRTAPACHQYAQAVPGHSYLLAACLPAPARGLRSEALPSASLRSCARRGRRAPAPLLLGLGTATVGAGAGAGASGSAACPVTYSRRTALTGAGRSLFRSPRAASSSAVELRMILACARARQGLTMTQQGVDGGSAALQLRRGPGGHHDA